MTTTNDAALERRPLNALSKPDYIKSGDTRGTENIGTDDIKFPALRLAQAMSPEVKRSEAEYIDGLREGELFNSLNKHIYGEDPVRFIIINQLGHRNVQFDPNDRKVVIDGNVTDDDPRCQFTEQIVDGAKKRFKPLATRFYDYLILLLPQDGEKSEPELLTLSLKSTQIKKAKELNTLLKTSKMPSFSFVWLGTPVPERKGNNSWYGWKFSPAGWTPEDIFKQCSTDYDKFAGKAIAVEADVDTNDDAGPGAPAADTDIPF